MYPSPKLRAELAAVNAHHDMMERHLKNLTKEADAGTDSEFFTLKMMEKVFLMKVEADGYYFEPFDIYTRPEKLRHIITIQEDSTKGFYKVRCYAYSSNEQIYAELEKLILPF